MLKTISIFILSFYLLHTTLLAESTMKCETGKCSSAESSSLKNIPTKATINSTTDNQSKTFSNKEKKYNTPTIEQLFNVKTVNVARRIDAKEQVNYGYIVTQDSAIVDVSTRYSGFVEKLYADTLYTKVNQGDPLVKVYSPEVYKAKQDYLNSLNYNTRTPMPAMLKSAKIKLQLLGIDEKEIKKIEKEKHVDQFSTVYAPVSGWIFEKNINNGTSFSSQKRLLQIVNLDTLWMEVKLFQNELATLNSLKHFKVTVKGIDETFNAKKSLLYPMLNPKEATATLRLILDNSSGILKPGMYAKVHATAAKKSRLVIPRTAAIRKNGSWYAFLATEFKGEYEPIQIDIKPLDNSYYEIVKGLNEGDILVNNALFMMDSDAQINSVY